MDKDREIKLNLPEILGIPKKGIIFSDLDGVWFDENANFSSPAPEDLAIIQEAKNAGYWVVLNSDTGAIPLAKFATELDCSPLVIGENGMVIYAPTVDSKEFLVPIRPLFDEFRQLAIAELTSFGTLSGEGSLVINDDATAIIRKDPKVPYPETPLYLINAMRECSFGVYVRFIDKNGKMRIDEKRTKQTETILNALIMDITTRRSDENVILTCKRYDTVGSCLVRDPRVYKARAVGKVIQQMPSTLNYYMIGDSTNDAMDFLGGKVTTCAVGNANSRLKQISLRSGGIVAPANLRVAQGANYVIREILMKG